MTSTSCRLLALAFVLAASAAHAENCFQATGSLGADAQTIRQNASAMGWTVSAPASLSFAGVVKGKVAIYPKGSVAVCMQENAGKLGVRIQASSSDAGRAEWHVIPAKKA